MDLVLPVKRRWFEDIKAGRKDHEYRLYKPYWYKRLVGRTYDRVIVTLGYPKKDDDSRRLIFKWSGYKQEMIRSEEWGNEEKHAFSIPLKPHS